MMGVLLVLNDDFHLATMMGVWLVGYFATMMGVWLVCRLVVTMMGVWLVVFYDGCLVSSCLCILKLA